MNFHKFLLLSVLSLQFNAVCAKGLECWLPSRVDGKELERLVVNMTGSNLSVVESRPERAERPASKMSREVLFHQFTDPRVKGRDRTYSAEPPHSLVLLRSADKELEFAADILVIDWGRGKLKSGSPYQESFQVGWRCTRLD